MSQHNIGKNGEVYINGEFVGTIISMETLTSFEELVKAIVPCCSPIVVGTEYKIGEDYEHKPTVDPKQEPPTPLEESEMKFLGQTALANPSKHVVVPTAKEAMGIELLSRDDQLP